jgi:hypothetical protein
METVVCTFNDMTWNEMKGMVRQMCNIGKAGQGTKYGNRGLYME